MNFKLDDIKKFNTNDGNFFFPTKETKKVVLQQFSIYGLNETYKIQIVFEQSKLVKQQVISFQN